MTNKEMTKMIEGYLERYDLIQNEIKYIKELLRNQNEISVSEKAYLIACGEKPNIRYKTEQDIEFVKNFLNDQPVMNLEYQVPCVHHVENAEFCEVYGVHMSKCPLVCSDNNCFMLDTGIPKTSIAEERFGKWMAYNMPELTNELSKFLKNGEMPPATLIKGVIDARTNYGMQNTAEYLHTLKARQKPKKNQRKPIPTRMRFEVLKRDGFKCRYCGCTPSDGAKLHVDHIVPVSKGGKDEMDNFRTACETCNIGKSDIELGGNHEHIPNI